VRCVLDCGSPLSVTVHQDDSVDQALHLMYPSLEEAVYLGKAHPSSSQRSAGVGWDSAGGGNTVKASVSRYRSEFGVATWLHADLKRGLAGLGFTWRQEHLPGGAYVLTEAHHFCWVMTSTSYTRYI
jgi:hypothetical protein